MLTIYWCIKQKYELIEEWTGNLYCGIKLNWDYDACTVDLSMPGYIKRVLQKSITAPCA